MAFSGIGKLIKDLVTGTPADTDYFAFGNTDLKKVSFPNLKKALGIDALNSALGKCFSNKYSSENKDWLGEYAMGLYWMRPDINTQNHPSPGKYGWLLDFEEVKIAIMEDGVMYINRRFSQAWKGWRQL